MTSPTSYTMRFSRPNTTSRLRRPISASRQATRFPSSASATPTLAVVVVLPTPPLPEVTVMIRAGIAPPSFHLPRLGDDLAVAHTRHFRRGLAAATFRRARKTLRDAQLRGRQIERAHDRGLIAHRPGVHRAAQFTPHHD